MIIVLLVKIKYINVVQKELTLVSDAFIYKSCTDIEIFTP